MIQSPSRTDAPWANDTRERILDAAERLFAEHGIEGVSLRQITREADVNIAAIHYHYGTRDDLARAVLDRVIVPINHMRIALLDEALAASGSKPLALKTILDAFLRPDLVTVAQLRGHARGVSVARFLAQTYSQPSPAVQAMIAEQFAGVGARFIGELARTLPDIDRREIEWRMRTCVVGVVVGLFAHAPATGDIELELDRLIAFVAPGLAADVPTKNKGKKR